MSFKDQDGGIIYILWFGADWIGADDDNDSYPSLARVKADDVTELKALLGVAHNKVSQLRSVQSRP